VPALEPQAPMLDATVATPLDAHNRMPVPPGHLRCGSRRWACCYTHPQAERWALLNLTRQGFDAYLPLVTVTRHDRATPTIRHRVKVPAFPRYLFVCIQSLWAPIRHTRGIASLLMTNGQPSIVAEAEIQALQAAEALAATKTQDAAKWAPGDAVALRRGYAFEGLPGVVLSVRGDEALVSLMFLGHLREIHVSTDALESREDF
jgi:transcriptional antiterminator RfaH